MDVIRQWLSNKINHKEIGQYLKDILPGPDIAIYGAGELGELLYDDLSGWPDLRVKYFIDKNADSLYYGIDDMEIWNLKELGNAGHVDAILITPYHASRQIAAELTRVLRDRPQMISLEELVYRVE